MSGTGVTGLVSNLPNTVTPYPVLDFSLGLGGFRTVADSTARDGILPQFRVVGMEVTTQSDGVTWALQGGTANANWVPVSAGQVAFIIRNDLADLATRDSASFPNGCAAYVLSEQETYRLDTSTPLTTFNPLIIARGAGTGAWYKRSRAFVVGNFTLWVCITAGFVANDQMVYGYTPGQLLAGAAAADIALDLNALAVGDSEFINAAIADTQGNLWVTAYHTTHSAPGLVYKFALKDILKSGTPTPKLKLIGTPRAACGNQASAFDKTNALWTMIFNTGLSPFTLRKYGAPAYATTGTPAADLEITLNNGLGEYQDMTIDAEGNIWVSSFQTGSGGANGEVVMVAAAQLQSSQAALVPAVRWIGTNFHSPVGLCFGPTGLLWVANYGAGGATSNLSAYAPQNPVSGNQAPVIVLTGINGIIGVEFDNDGNAWVNSQDDGRQYFLTAAQITASGAPVPGRFVANPSGQFPQSSTFPNNPQRSGLVFSGAPMYP